MEIPTVKNLKSRREKIVKSDFAPPPPLRKYFLLRPCFWWFYFGNFTTLVNFLCFTFKFKLRLVLLQLHTVYATKSSQK